MGLTFNKEKQNAGTVIQWVISCNGTEVMRYARWISTLLVAVNNLNTFVHLTGGYRCYLCSSTFLDFARQISNVLFLLVLQTSQSVKESSKAR